jgi:uncharacterized protein YndB with AHSA1/START domain
MKHEPFVIERTFQSPLPKVWKALTVKEEMKKWYFDLEAFKPEVGFEFSFSGGPEDRKYLHLCKVTEVIAEKKITYSWRYDGYEGISYVTFELFAEGNERTKLKLTHSGLETFPPLADFARTNFEAGWASIVNESLQGYLEKH